MEIEDVVALLESLDGTLLLRPQPGDGTPEVAWGDVFCYYAPDGVIPAGQPFATVVTKNYPDDESGDLSRPGAFRVNVAAGTPAYQRILGRSPRDPADGDPTIGDDTLSAHPVYGELGWLAVTNPGPRTAAALRELLTTAYALARSRTERRDATRSPEVGTLDWRPAREHPELLAEPVRTALAGSELTAFVAPIDPELADTAAFCAAYAVPAEVSANCVVVAGRRADTAVTAACLVLATDRADVNRIIRKHLGVRRVSFASMADATARSGMEYGGITPVGLPADWPVLVDAAVAAAEWIVIGSGIRGSKLLIRGTDAAGLPTAEVLDLRIEDRR